MKKENKWKEIFNSKKMSYNFETLKFLKKIKKKKYSNLSISFHLTKIIYPLLTQKIYTQMLNFFLKEIKFFKKENISNILDFGSGNGAFLFYLINTFKLKNNYSVELSKTLLSLQKKIIFDAKFLNINNNNKSELKNIKKNTVDVFISMSVFQYFKSNNYCINIINDSISITKKIIILYDIKNSEYKDQYLKTLLKRNNLNKKEFQIKYKNTPLRFYKKSFFLKNFLKNKKVKKIQFKKMPKHALDSKYGYSVIIRLTNQ